MLIALASCMARRSQHKVYYSPATMCNATEICTVIPQAVRWGTNWLWNINKSAYSSSTLPKLPVCLLGSLLRFATIVALTEMSTPSRLGLKKGARGT